jgi:hypothetical protein
MRPFRIPAALAGATLAIALAACGSSSTTAPAGLVITGPGLQAAAAPWAPEYSHLSQRISEMKLPPTGNEKFHIHALLHIYKDGLLVPVPADIGIDTAHHVETSLHTHDGTGIIHMETNHPYKFTLGDFFKVWGVKLGPEQLGDLRGAGADGLHFYVNGRKLTDPAAYVMHRGDSIVIGYGAVSSFPHTPGTQILKEVEEGKGGFSCSTKPGGKAKSCIVRSGTSTTGATSTTPAPTSTTTKN